MPCYRPLQAWRGDLQENGKRQIVFKRPANALEAFELKLPCGQCIGCRLERSRQWAMRCMDEASLYKKNCFITLTYDNEHLPDGGGLDKREFPLFMKRLRKEYGQGIRYFHCGEYGETNGRPHYHACLFNFNFPDCVLYKISRNGDKLYISESLNKIWGKGIAVIGNVTFESAAYVARYVMKKVTGPKADEHYLIKETGEILQSEYVTMSRGSKKLKTGGIGKGWYEKWKGDVYPRDEKAVRGKLLRPPRFYDKMYEIECPEDMQRIRCKRVSKFNAKDNDSFRLTEKERCVTLRMKEMLREV